MSDDTPVVAPTEPVTPPVPTAPESKELTWDDVLGPAPAETAPDAATPPTENPAPDDPAPAEAEAPVFDVDIPLPNGDGENGTTNAGTLKLQLPTQEARDALQFHLKQSARAVRLDAKLDAYAADAAQAAFLKANPADGLLALAAQHPEATDDMVGLYAAMNPERIVALVQQMGFQIGTEGVSRDTLRLQAENAQLKLHQRLATSQQSFEAKTGEQQFALRAGEVLQDLATTMGVPSGSPEFQKMVAVASLTAQQLYHQNPKATMAELMAAIQPDVQRFAPTGAPVRATVATASPHHSQAQPRDDVGQFAKAAQATLQRQQALRRVAGGTPATMAVGVEKVPPGTTLDDIVAGRVR